MPELVTLGVNYRVAVHDSVADVQRNAARLAGAVADRYGIRLRAFEGEAGVDVGLGPESGAGPGTRNAVDYNGTLYIRTGKTSAPTPVTPADGPVWDAFAGVIRHTFAAPNRTVVPAAEGMTGNTDTRHYLNLSRNIFRWTPVRLGQFAGIHTYNEGVLMSGHMDMVKFYYNLVRVFSGDRFHLDASARAPSEL
ncbi:hypothetical protein CDD83_4346 [Cordyceps sp. RAO-2017]|nr:hypothetical protein CDD83_4346 [Cordyceps sp. RAO-2017]